jgi:thioredoxin-dependent peroxiredoxin
MALSVGTKAPDFAVNDQDGKLVKLSDLKGKKIVLYFYPKDMTPGCTAEACSLRDNYKALQKAGYEIFGISSDDEKRHRKFIEQQKLPFQLLADTDKAVHYKYGTWDENGVISEVIEKVDTKNHASQILGDTISAPAKATVSSPKKGATTKVVKTKKAVKKTAPKKTRKAAKKKKR